MSRTVVTIHGPNGKILVGNLANARRAVEALWPKDESERIVEVRRLFGEAASGACSPRAALTAFLEAARQDYRVTLPESSRATREIDALMGR